MMLLPPELHVLDADAAHFALGQVGPFESRKAPSSILARAVQCKQVVADPRRVLRITVVSVAGQDSGQDAAASLQRRLVRIVTRSSGRINLTAAEEAIRTLLPAAISGGGDGTHSLRVATAADWKTGPLVGKGSTADDFCKSSMNFKVCPPWLFIEAMPTLVDEAIFGPGPAEAPWLVEIGFGKCVEVRSVDDFSLGGCAIGVPADLAVSQGWETEEAERRSLVVKVVVDPAGAGGTSTEPAVASTVASAATHFAMVDETVQRFRERVGIEAGDVGFTCGVCHQGGGGGVLRDRTTKRGNGGEDDAKAAGQPGTADAVGFARRLEDVLCAKCLDSMLLPNGGSDPLFIVKRMNVE